MTLVHNPGFPRIGKKAAAPLPAEHLWFNPDCGLKTRGWQELRQEFAR